MKILYLSTTFSRDNGWGRNAEEVLRRLPALGIQPLVGVQGAGLPATIPAAAVVGGLVSQTDQAWKCAMAEWDALRLGRLAIEASAIHCLTEPYMPLAAILAARNRIPLIITCHGTYSILAAKGARRRLYAKAFSGADALIAVSRYTMSRTLAVVPGVRSRIRAVSLGVDRDFGDSIPRPAAARELAFLTVGQVKPRKGLDQIVEALPQVLASYPQAKIYVAGSLAQKDFVARVKHRATELKVASSIIWLGRVEEPLLREYYRQVRGLVLPSQNVGDHFEGFGLIHLEANAFGVPAIGSLDCGNEDAIQHLRSGYLVHQGDISDLGNKMMALLGPEQEWDALSRSAHQFANEMSWSRTVEGYLSAYKDAGLHVT